MRLLLFTVLLKIGVTAPLRGEKKSIKVSLKVNTNSDKEFEISNHIARCTESLDP